MAPRKRAFDTRDGSGTCICTVQSQTLNIDTYTTPPTGIKYLDETLTIIFPHLD